MSALVTLGTAQVITGAKTFEGTTTFGTALAVNSSFTANATDVSTTQHLTCYQGLRGQMFTQASNSFVGRKVLGGLLRCNGTGQTIPILLASDHAGGFFDVIIANPTTLTLSSGTFTGSMGSGTSTVALSPIRSTHYHLSSDGSNWRVHSTGLGTRSVIVTGATTLGSEVFGGTITVSGTASYTITLPSPVETAGAQFELMMNVGLPITISTPVGWIGGISGNYEASRVLTSTTASQHNRFFSDGANWNMISQVGITPYGDISIPSRVTASEFFILGNNITTLFAPRSALPQLRARITFANPPVVLSSSGAQTLTNTNVALTSTGQYTITFPTAVSTNTYGVLVTARATTPYFMTYGSVATTGFVVNV